VSPTVGWLVGSYRSIHSPAGALMMRTTDGGHTWDSVPFPRKPVLSLSAVSFRDDQHGWVASGDGTAEGQIFQTDNGGQTWTALPLGSAGPFNDIALTDTTHGYAVTTELVDLSQTLLATADGGHTWQHTTLPGPNNLANVFVTGHDQAVALGGPDYPANATIMITTDGGTTWSAVQNTLPTVANASFIGPKGWAVSRGPGPCVFSSGDGGRTWSEVSLIAGATCPTR
jgi:photosystem II stability/assembly factor-like uncharacterized protein